MRDYPPGMSDNPKPAPPTAADVEAAAKRLAGFALRTPLVSSPVLDAVTGARVFMKAETLQRTGSFKFRGAFNKLSSIPADKRAGGVVAFSSGNHAQGVAHAAKLLDMPSVIVMPMDAPCAKRERTAAFGAQVVLYDREKEDREGIARKIAQDARRDAGAAVRRSPHHRRPGHRGPRDHGRSHRARRQAGHRGDRRLRRRPCGRHLARACKSRAPGVKIYTAEPEGFDDTARSFVLGKHEHNARLSGCDLRRADVELAGPDHVRDQPRTDRRRRRRQPTRKSAARWRSRSAS